MNKLSLMGLRKVDIRTWALLENSAERVVTNEQICKFSSGLDMAEMGRGPKISRVAYIRKTIKRLRAFGLKIETVRGSGYFIVKERTR